MTRFRSRICIWLLTASWLVASLIPDFVSAKSYSSGGHSYSSSSSHSSGGGSHSFSSGSHSYSSGSSSRSSSGGGSSSWGSSKSFSSSGKSYSAGSSRDPGNRHGYSSGKSYGAGSGNTFTPRPPSSPSRQDNKTYSSPSSKPSDSGFSFDTAAARARKEQASKTDFQRFKDSKTPPIINSSDRSSGPSAGSGRTVSSGTPDYSRRYVYVPDVTVIRTRPARIYNIFYPYYYRPLVVYHDPYSSFFWWWLLDRSLDDQAWWAYHHRYDMDPARYQALMASNQQLEARVTQLEAQQAPRDPTYTPTGLDRDLMYSDHYVAQAYDNRPTRSGSIAFWILGMPLAAAFCAFLIWLIWFKRWQTAT